MTDELPGRHAVPDLPHPPPEPDYLSRTAHAQRVLAGQAKPSMPLDSRLGVSMDVASGVLSCPTCGADSVKIIEARTYPSISFPTNAAVGFECLLCSRPFAISFDLEEERGGVVMRSVRER